MNTPKRLHQQQPLQPVLSDGRRFPSLLDFRADRDKMSILVFYSKLCRTYSDLLAPAVG